MNFQIGIIGGLGSYASCYFYKKLLDNIDIKKEQDYPNIILLNHSSIPDRTEYILNNTLSNPYDYLLNDVLMLENLGVSHILILCNTAHYYYKKLQEKINIPIINMIEDTAYFLKKNNIDSITLLATTGTINSGLYQNYLEKYNIKCILIDQEKQKKLMEIIYNEIKLGKKVNIELLKEIISGIDTKYIVLGCTELSIIKDELEIKERLIDPLEIEINNIIELLNKRKKEIK